MPGQSTRVPTALEQDLSVHEHADVALGVDHVPLRVSRKVANQTRVSGTQPASVDEQGVRPRALPKEAAAVERMDHSKGAPLRSRRAPEFHRSLLYDGTETAISTVDYISQVRCKDGMASTGSPATLESTSRRERRVREVHERILSAARD